MTITRKKTWGLAFVAAALLFSAVLATTSAQAPPFTAYGSGLDSGDTVTAWVGGDNCGSATVDASGNWLIYVEATASCGASDGDTIEFSLNGDTCTQTETYLAGGAPSNVAQGIALSGCEPDATPTPDDDDDDDAPPPSDTGNAGLLGGSAGASLAVVMLLGVAAATLVAGARTATRRS